MTDSVKSLVKEAVREVLQAAASAERREKQVARLKAQVVALQSDLAEHQRRAQEAVLVKQLASAEDDYVLQVARRLAIKHAKKHGTVTIADVHSAVEAEAERNSRLTKTSPKVWSKVFTSHGTVRWMRIRYDRVVVNGKSKARAIWILASD